MPIPKPKTGEKQEEYMNRCMEKIGGEFEDNKQAVAVCFAEWRKKDAIDFDDIYNNDLYENEDIERPNYHSARVKDPEMFQEETFKTKTLPGSNVLMVIGRLKGKTTTTVQTYLFPKEEYTMAQVKTWLKENKVTSIKIEPAKESKDSTDTVIEQRFDMTDLMEYSRLNGLEESFQKTDEGYLTGKAIVTNIGVFTYRNADGSLRRELRLPEEVFHPDSLNTLKMKPISNNHPDELVIDAENIKKYQVGFTGSEIYTDPYHLAIPITVTDQKAIDDVDKGKRALSAGYSLMLEHKSGVWGGVPYDAIQRNIRYNHVAIVDRGRAGDAAKIRMDEADNIMYSIGWEDNQVDTALENIEKEDKTLSNENLQLKAITLDGVDYKAEAEVIKTVNGLQKQVDSLAKELNDLKTEKSKLEADRDTLKDEVDQLKKDATDDTKIEERIQKRIRVLSAADMASVSVDKKSEIEIMKEVILKKYPNANLDGKDDVYIHARFDAAVEQMEADVDKSKTETIFSYLGDNGDRQISADEARKRMIQNTKNASRGIKEGDK